jgi:hypothetical protein
MCKPKQTIITEGDRFTKFCILRGARHINAPGDFCSVNFENWVFLTENWLPKLLVLLKYVFKRGILLRLLLCVAVISLMLGIA